MEKNFCEDQSNHPNMMGMMPPSMPPQLARMRDAMGQMRRAPFGDRQQIRSRLRDAMKIQDQAKREAALKKIMEEMDPEESEPEDAPQDTRGAKASSSK